MMLLGTVLSKFDLRVGDSADVLRVAEEMHEAIRKEGVVLIGISVETIVATLNAGFEFVRGEKLTLRRAGQQ